MASTARWSWRSCLPIFGCSPALTATWPRADAAIPDARTVAVEPGDTLVCVTDGVTEAESAAGVPFGSDRLLNVVARHRHESAGEIIDAVWAAIGEFSGRSTFLDDATAIVVKARFSAAMQRPNMP